MTADRRDDLGGKVIVGVLIAVIGASSVSFIGAAWSVAYDGKKKADEVSDRVTAMEARFSGFQSDLTEIKDLLKRGVPNGR